MEGNWGSVLLKGGRGSRMGQVDKAGLSYEGETFETVIGRQLSGLCRPCFVSEAAWAETERRKTLTSDWPVIPDSVRDESGRYIGPMGGICSCLTHPACETLSGLLFVSCDMPLFRQELASRLFVHYKEGDDCLLWRTRDGRLHPVCGFYFKSCLPALLEEIKSGHFKMMSFLSKINCHVVDIAREHLPEEWFFNVNTPEAYERLAKRRPPVLAVSGRKNTGKTWLLERLVKELSDRGLRVAVIKHDGHDFVPDTPGTDSFRMKAAGAWGTVVYSGSRFCLIKDEPGHEAEDFFAYFPNVDMILLEGQKNSCYPKMEVLRKSISTEPVCSPDRVIAYVRDWEEPWMVPGDVPVYDFTQIEEILECVLTHSQAYPWRPGSGSGSDSGGTASL